MLPPWLQLQQQQLLPWAGQRHCCDNAQVALLCSSSAGVGPEIQVCYLSAASLPVPSPEPPELAADVSVGVSSPYLSLGVCPFIPVLCVPSGLVLSQHPGLSWWLCVEPGVGWVFQDGGRSYGRWSLQRGVAGCAPQCHQLCPCEDRPCLLP